MNVQAWKMEALAYTLCAGIAAQAAAVAQSTWNQVAIGGPGPCSECSVAYDLLRQRTILFGGIGPSGVRGDTWEWNGSSWMQIAVPGPGARFGHATTYDSQRSRIVLFGGLTGGGMHMGDTWEWDGSAWLPQVFASGPGNRQRHAMAYDIQRGRTVLFGGLNSQGIFGDTWEWDGVSWALRSSVGPSPRFAHAMAYDPIRGRTVLYGGASPGTSGIPTTFHGDTWEWDGATWTQVVSGANLSHSDHAMAYDGRIARVLKVGGWNGTVINETLAWYGTAWSVVSAMAPGGYGMKMAYDHHRMRSVLVEDSGDTWELSTSIANGNPYGMGCGSPPLLLSGVIGSPPTLGAIAQASIGNIPSAITVMAVGFNNAWYGPFALPLTLVSFGMTGCNLLHSADVFGLGVSYTSPGTATFSQQIPNNPSLVGLRLYLQAFAVAIGVNPGGVIASNGLEWHIG